MGENNGKHMKEDDGLFVVPEKSDIDELDDIEPSDYLLGKIEEALNEPDELDETNDLSAVYPDVPKYLLPNKAYNVLKLVSIELLPVVGWAIGELLPDYGIDPYKAVHFIDVVGVVIAVLIGASEFSAIVRKHV